MGKKQTMQMMETVEVEKKEGQMYARSLGPRGNNQHEVELVDGTISLATLPPHFRNVIWVKRGHFVIVEPLEGTQSEKVCGEIIRVLFPKHIKALEKAGQWPATFSQKQPSKTSALVPSEQDLELEESDENDDDLFVNNNRPVLSETDESSDEETEDEHH